MAVCWAIDPAVDVHTAGTGLRGEIAEGIAAEYTLRKGKQEQIRVGSLSKGAVAGCYEWNVD